MIWLLQNYKGKFQEFSFDCFKEDLSPFKPAKYQELIVENKCLHSVEKLDLSNCNLEECPDLSCLQNISDLRLENNKIQFAKGA